MARQIISSIAGLHLESLRQMTVGLMTNDLIARQYTDSRRKHPSGFHEKITKVTWAMKPWRKAIARPIATWTYS
jgi:hypothetical protein